MMKAFAILLLASTTFSFLLTPTMMKEREVKRLQREKEIKESNDSIEYRYCEGDEGIFDIQNVESLEPIRAKSIVNFHFTGRCTQSGVYLATSELTLSYGIIPIITMNEPLEMTTEETDIDGTIPIDFLAFGTPIIPGKYGFQMKMKDQNKKVRVCIAGSFTVLK